jgi:hypothetical protein
LFVPLWLLHCILPVTVPALYVADHVIAAAFQLELVPAPVPIVAFKSGADCS